MNEKYETSATDNPFAIQGVFSSDGLIERMGGKRKMEEYTKLLLGLEIGEHYTFPVGYSRKVVRAFLLFKGFNIINSKEKSMFATSLLGDGRVKVVRKQGLGARMESKTILGDKEIEGRLVDSLIKEGDKDD